MTATLDIRTHAGTPAELEAQETLEHLVARYRLEPWCLTREVLIVEAAPPRSHPVLRLSARRRSGELADERWLLACFIHEQCHWVTQSSREATEAAISDLRVLFSEVPVGGREGAQTAWSTYLHLIVCWLEYGALCELLGTDQARTTLRSNSGYQWIYERVFADAGAIAGPLHATNFTYPSEPADNGCCRLELPHPAIACAIWGCRPCCGSPPSCGG